MAEQVRVVISPGATAFRIAPVRFARAITDEFSDADAPDIDDRSYILPDTFQGVARGPVVGITQGKTIRVLVVRDRLDNAAALHPVISDTAVAVVDFPPAGAPLDHADTPAAPDGSTPLRQGDCVFLSAAATGPVDLETTLQVHFGSPSGPILAEMAVRVYVPLVVPVQAHLVTINGQAPAADEGSIDAMFAFVNSIYAQAGVQFDLNPTALTESFSDFARAGTVTLDKGANREVTTVMNANPVPGVLNAYFFGHFFDETRPAGRQRDQVLGIGFSSITALTFPPSGAFLGLQSGIVVRDSADLDQAAHTVAHEIGHILTLEHYARGNPPNRREDIWAHRCLMHNILGLNAADRPGEVNRFHRSSARTVVGYGIISENGKTLPATGQLLTTKKLTNIEQSDQINELRIAVNNATFAPVRV